MVEDIKAVAILAAAGIAIAIIAPLLLITAMLATPFLALFLVTVIPFRTIRNRNKTRTTTAAQLPEPELQRGP